jgi:hypothetical protein
MVGGLDKRLKTPRRVIYISKVLVFQVIHFLERGDLLLSCGDNFNVR